MPQFKVPDVAIQRLSIYLRALRKLEENRILSSLELAELIGTSDGQVRKDLAYFGGFGIPGQGYPVKKLRREITRILGLDRTWKVALAGVGKLGSALLAYPGLRQSGFLIRVIFDNDPAKIGKVREGLRIQSSETIPQVVSQEGIKIGIITTPAEAAQKVTNQLIEGGVRGILNFAPTIIVHPSELKLKNVDLSTDLETLSYFLKKREAKASPTQQNKNFLHG